ncbi:MAG TPA: GMP synthase (glutamine-hydrolyzing), partial [Clostridia bacterium]|nr:GMP synthase (glutamine-hydrolyzing) [Clostridia bacterium]
MQDQILILNFDNAYSATIASRLRAERIAAKILPGHATAEQVLAQESLGVILSGGINGDIPVSLDGQLLRSGIPVLALGNVVPAVITLLGGQVEEA